MNLRMGLFGFSLSGVAAFASLSFATPSAEAAVAVAARKGACCFANGTCQILSSRDCLRAGGTYKGNGTTCADCPPPPPPTGACCVGTTCVQTTAADCAAQGGDYNGDNSTCFVYPPLCEPLPPDGACCIPGLGGTFCAETNEFACFLQGGEFFGPGTTCEDVICVQPPPPPGPEEQ